MNPEPIYGLPPVWRGPSYMALPLAGEVNWGMEIFGVNKLRSITDGDGLKIGVVDTGIDPDHPLLAPNFVAAKDFTGSRNGFRDVNGHGTHCSGTVAAVDPRIGVGPGFKLYHGKGLGDGGSGGNSLIDAMWWCIGEGCEILSCSWGGGGRSEDWEREFQKMIDANVWLIFAGGNSGPNTPDTDYPGRSEKLLNVAALGLDLRPASFSSAGDKIDMSGPGVNIISARPGGGFATMSGTSMATPFNAACSGLFRASRRKLGMSIPTTFEMREMLSFRAVDVHTPGDDRRTGPGAISPLLLALNLTPDPPPIATAMAVECPCVCV
jgi:subtilisin family serine protease